MYTSLYSVSKNPDLERALRSEFSRYVDLVLDQESLLETQESKLREDYEAIKDLDVKFKIEEGKVTITGLEDW